MKTIVNGIEKNLIPIASHVVVGTYGVINKLYISFSGDIVITDPILKNDDTKIEDFMDYLSKFDHEQLDMICRAKYGCYSAHIYCLFMGLDEDMPEELFNSLVDNQFISHSFLLRRESDIQ